MDDLRDYSEELSKNSAKYNDKDWEKSELKYEKIEKNLGKYEYTDSELQEIGRLKARCFKVRSEAAVHNLQKEIHSFGEQMKGAIDELGNSEND